MGYRKSTIPSDVKIDLNMLLARWMVDNNFHTKKFLGLDGSLMLTCNTLNKFGMSRNKMYIPECDEETQKIHANSGVHSYAGTLNEFIRTKSMDDFNSLFLDYTGRITGNHSLNNYPMSDIHLFLSKTRQERICMAITACIARQPSERNGKVLVSYILTDMLGPLFQLHQFKTVSEYHHAYNQTDPENPRGCKMLFMLFELEKDLSITTADALEKIKFHECDGYSPSDKENLPRIETFGTTRKRKRNYEFGFIY